MVETDLGEWIIQLAKETPSHIIAPAVHRDRYQVHELFAPLPGGDRLEPVPEELAAFARDRLRQAFLAADLGISGVNFGVAETGSLVLVTNEGNGRMCTTLPKVHVAVMGMERVVATWDQLDLLLNLLVASATGQVLSSYTSIIRSPRQPGEADGPDEFHLVILDNGRSEILGSELHEILACIRCGACLNVCPVYRQVGGHAYGGVYSRPGRRRAHPAARRAGAANAAEVPQRLVAVRRVHGRLPGRHPAPGPAADPAPAQPGVGPRDHQGGLEGVGRDLVETRAVPGLDQGRNVGPAPVATRRPHARRPPVGRGPHDAQAGQAQLPRPVEVGRGLSPRGRR